MTLSHNTTPYHVETYPVQDKDGNPMALTVTKATYTFSLSGEVGIADEQVPITLGDEYRGDVKTTSIRYASDLVPEKRGTDIALNGHAHAPQGKPVKKLQVGLAVGNVSKTMTVWGDRFWQFSMGMVSKSRSFPFVKMPLVYERAFGGEDRFHDNEKKWGVCNENPVGTGFRLNRNKEALDGLKLPNIEDPKQLMVRWNDKPKPSGFGFIAPYWAPRVSQCGTFDEAWDKGRRPLLPKDFDLGFYNAATPDLISKPFLKGIETVFLKNLHPAAERLSFKLPNISLVNAYIFEHQTYKPKPVLDTLIIEPDENRFILVFRSHYSGPEKLSHLKQVHVYEKA